MTTSPKFVELVESITNMLLLFLRGYGLNSYEESKMGGGGGGGGGGVIAKKKKIIFS